MDLRPHRMTVVLAVLLVCGVARSVVSQTAGKIEFNRDVRPILSDNCFRCHGPDKNQRKAKLRLDVREVALEKEAFAPGKPDESELIRRINTTNEDDVMPPLEMHKTLTAAQKKLLRDWIAQGAEYQPHWAYISPTRPKVPKVGGQKSEVGSPIDAFVWAELERRKIKPSPEVDRRTLLRRLSLDLIGLPPMPQEIESFLNDKSPDAYEKQVNRLLASPHFGERMAATWLDLARYADTVGYHGDQNQNVFPYRDYVINSFNANKPFDQFTIEQLAGDLLPNPTVEQKTATAFNRLNMVTREGGAQPKEYLAKYAADRVRTVSTTWLGSTMACCECHDHKYDPFSTKDFYSLGAFFADVKQWGVYADYSYTPNPDLRGFNNEYPFPPEIEVESPYLERRIEKFRGRIAETHASAAAKLKADARRRAVFDDWRKGSLAFMKRSPTGWAAPKPQVVLKMKDPKLDAATNFTVLADSTVSFRGARENTTLTLPLSNMWLAAIRIEVVPEAGAVEKAGKDKRRNGAAFALAAILKSPGTNAGRKLTFSFGDANHKEERYSQGAAQIGVMEAWSISRDHDLQHAVWLLKEPINVSDGSQLVINLGNAVVSSVRVSVSPFAAENPLKAGGGEPLRKALVKSTFGRSRTERDLVNETYLLSTAWDADTFAKAQSLFTEVRQCLNGRAMTLVTEAREPVTTRVLPRGNWQDESGEIVPPVPPHFLPQPNASGTNRLTRLDLARWLVSPENPLTARTFVNRLWKQFFGIGLSAVVDDLGAQGEWPTHPELLDWLAVEFRESGWNVKHLTKLIVTSATYRQTAGPRPDLKDIDPNNRLLAAQSPRRLDAEFVRDNALAVAGLLNSEIGGPSARPYQPPGYYAQLQFPDRDYFADKDDRQYRRGVYSWWQRTFLQPMLANFDAPAREECTAARNLSNTPQQALTLLNDPTFVEASRMFAAKLLAEKAASDAQRFDLAFQRALARPIKSNECASLEKFLAQQREYYDANAGDAKKLLRVGNASEPTIAGESELAAWTQVCRVVLNLHETITRY